MRLGLLTDIHEHVDNLRWALKTLRDCQVDRILVLGDIFETGANIEATIDALSSVQHASLFGNHDLGLCIEPEAEIVAKYASKIMDYFARCVPFIEVEDNLFTHGMPDWDPADPTIYYVGDPIWEKSARDRAFRILSHRLFFMGHFHCWAIYGTEGQLNWDGQECITLDPSQRYLVVIRPVVDAACAVFDTHTGMLTPYAR